MEAATTRPGRRGGLGRVPGLRQGPRRGEPGAAGHRPLGPARPAAPLEASVAGFLAGLEAARAELPAWDHPALAGAQAATAAALDAAERRARDLPAASDGLEFEHRNERVADVLDELLPVQAAERPSGPCGAGATRPGPAAGRPGRGGSRRRPPGPRP